MRETGTVMGLASDVAYVAVVHPSACRRTGVCSRIGDDVVLQVPLNPDDQVAIGDVLLLEISADFPFLYVVVLYLMSLVGLLLGAVLGFLLTLAFWSASPSPNLLALFLSLAGLCVGFFFARWYDRHHSETRYARIIHRI